MGIELQANSEKVAVISGASRGIGRAIALKLAEQRICLVLTARSEAALAETAKAAQQLGSKVRLVATPDGAPDLVVSTAITEFGALDILINNAGTTKSGDFLKLTDSDWAEGYGTKFFGAMRLCRSAWPELKRRHGSVINIAGAGGRTPDALFTLGGSVNAAVMAFTKALAQRGIEDDVQVNAINPGLIKTERLMKRIAAAMERWSVDQSEAERRMVSEQKITRFGEPSEIASLVAYIVSPAGRLLHGSIIEADAGFTKGV